MIAKQVFPHNKAPEGAIGSNRPYLFLGFRLMSKTAAMTLLEVCDIIWLKHGNGTNSCWEAVNLVWPRGETQQK